MKVRSWKSGDGILEMEVGQLEVAKRLVHLPDLPVGAWCFSYAINIAEIIYMGIDFCCFFVTINGYLRNSYR